MALAKINIKMFGLFRRKITDINKKTEFIAAMERVSQILLKNGFEGQSEAFTRPIAFLKANDIPNFLKSFNTVDIWGGSGAAWEVGGFSSWEKEKEFLVAFRHLIELMQHNKINYGNARRISKFFLQQLEGRN
jgi:hypothetical protein